MKPRIVIQQKITAFTNIYKILGTDDTGGTTDMIAYAQQKRLAFKEKVTFYKNDQKTEELFTFRAEKVMDVHGRYIVEDNDGHCMGMFKKEFKKSLLNSTWNIMSAEGDVVFTVRESNQTLAIARRFLAFIPYLGDLFELITNFMKYHFVFIEPKTNETVGRYQKTTLFRDHYTLSMTDGAYEKLDWRVLAAMGVALDALQSR
ncbi:MAG: hypothetical protein ABIQ64_01980 [Candidatus Saccharimonadales bacterium]